jgi:hypothetical protein
VIWGGFGAVVVWRRWGMMAFPALFMIYAVDELIWTTTYVLTTCNTWNSTILNGALGYYIMIWVMGAVTFILVRPKIRLHWWTIPPFIGWWFLYVFVLHMPIMGNLCLGTYVPSNLAWEVLWQFSYLVPAYFTFYPRSTNVNPKVNSPSLLHDLFSRS